MRKNKVGVGLFVMSNPGPGSRLAVRISSMESATT